MKCDPCVGPPPVFQDFADAGVWWAADWNAPENVFFTRLHVRYSIDRFPADLQFQVTPNNENYQVRYVLQNPATGPFDCDEAKEYLRNLTQRRSLEVDELYALTGNRDHRAWQYIRQYEEKPRSDGRPVPPQKPPGTQRGPSAGDTGLNPAQDVSPSVYTASVQPKAAPGDSESRRANVPASAAFVLGSLLILWLAGSRKQS
jgi:hypothetical protein